jgi:2-haloacid dehalogenase
MVSHAYGDSVAIMEGLDRLPGRDVTMLTNFAADTFRQAREMYPFLNMPRGVTVSGEIKLIKPDVAIYREARAGFRPRPPQRLFIDDARWQTSKAHEAAGWQAVQFTGAGEAEKRPCGARHCALIEGARRT